MVERGMELPSPFAGRYEILRELGHGASAVVYLVHDQQHDREVALKVLSPDYASALGPARFLREIRLVSRLQHPYIVPVLDSGEADGWLYFVMPLLEGQPLRARMTREGELPVADAVRYATEIADALQHAHEHGVLHRDVKPENILLSGQHACLADFGIARALTPATGDEITSTGVIMGTPAYMSPEQATSEAHIDGRSDQYALACVLFEMLAGIPPFVGASEQSVIAQRFHHPAPRLSQYRPAVGRALEEAVARALQMAPADRFSSLGAFAEALRRAMETPSMEELRAVAVPHPTRPASRRRWMAGVGAAIAAGAVVFTAWWNFTADGEALAAGSAASLISEPDISNGVVRDVFQKAKADFAAGRLDSAEAKFKRAVDLDPTLALASLWQAQLIQWRTDKTSAADWTVPARRALLYRNRLSARDAHHASALVALGEDRFPEACSHFRDLVEEDPQGFVGWFGLGECHRLDGIVVPDSASPSRWRFRAELSEAIAAYREALVLIPGEAMAPLLHRVMSVFYGEALSTRTGRTERGGPVEFLARPDLQADTLAFVPYRLGDVAKVSPNATPRRMGEALEEFRKLQLEFVSAWVQRMPSNRYALAALSLALELRGDLNAQHAGATDALSAIRSARRQVGDSREAVLFEAAEVRLLVKDQRFAEAGRVASSALGAQVLRDSVAAFLAALAALQGREQLLSAHLHALWSDPDEARNEFGMVVPPALAERIARLVAAVESGACTARRIDSLERQVSDLVSTLEAPDRRDAVNARLLAFPRRQAAPCTDGESARRLPHSEDRYVQLVRAAVHNDSSEVLELLRVLDTDRRVWSRRSMSWDAVALEGWALAKVGRLPQAAARLDSILDGIQFSSSLLTRHWRLTGGLRRTMKVRSDLALHLGDSVMARHWLSALDGLSQRR